MKTRRLFIITGLSGAGKSQALKCFEDFGFFCIDNLPIALIDGLIGLLMGSRGLQDVALGIDIREGEFLKDFSRTLRRLRAQHIDCRVIFLDAADPVVIQRFSETRRRHPLGGNVAVSIRKERRRLVDVKAAADKVVDTSDMTLGELKEKLSGTLGLQREKEMNLSVVSFGYKYGLPMDADLVMDVRFLPNPNYRPELKGKTGLESEVQAYITRHPSSREFLARYTDLLCSLLPQYVREGKSYLTLAVGCTGGRHRSVFVTHHLALALQKAGYCAKEFHRDIHR